ncbi:hypothetical protein KDJ21_023920 [Metabacillus litoralis]|uniref:hypothetical protein n=1 Tax=Metabacillus litoralis TaxID=152268 RepID=UPI000EF5FE17|nr:hypothetical protein [Metabacillus litoralis]MCM3408585.1 hypothetical protein [Metabacillus litoralis]UHA59750.1 hypothetical protein KDJ21_023920 [Metabacillus litoralis]
MKIVDQLKEFIVNQDVIPKSIKIHPDALSELESEKFVYIINKHEENPVKRFMGIELITSADVKGFDVIEEGVNQERWIVKKEVKKIREKYVRGKDNELSKDISLLFAYMGYLERELEDKTNYLNYLKEKETIRATEKGE